MGVEYRKRGSGSGNDTGSAARRKERTLPLKKRNMILRLVFLCLILPTLLTAAAGSLLFPGAGAEGANQARQILSLKIKWVTTDNDGDESRLYIRRDYDPDITFSMQYQIEAVLTGREPHEPGTVRILAPKQIFHKRGTSAGGSVLTEGYGGLTLAVPDRPSETAGWHWEDAGDGKYAIINDVTINAAAEVMFQCTITDLKAPDLVDMLPSDVLKAEVKVTDPATGEVLDTMTSGELRAVVDTRAKLDIIPNTSFTGATISGTVYTTAESISPNIREKVPGGLEAANNYIYVCWHTEPQYTATQYFNLDVDLWAGEAVGNGAAIPGIALGRIGGGGTFTTQDSGAQAGSHWTCRVSSYRFDNKPEWHAQDIWVAYPVEQMQADKTYSLTASAEWKMTEADPARGSDPQEVTQASAEKTVQYLHSEWNFPEGSFGVYKYTDSHPSHTHNIPARDRPDSSTNSYHKKDHTYEMAAGQLRNGQSVTIEYEVLTTGYGYVFTAGPTGEVPDMEEGWKYNPAHYLNWNYMMETTDNEVFLKQPNSRLQAGDYRFDGITVAAPEMFTYGRQTDSYYRLPGSEFGYKPDKNLTKPAVEIWIEKNRSGNWELYQTITDWRSETQKITFPDNVTGYRTRILTNQAACKLAVWPKITLLPSAGVMGTLDNLVDQYTNVVVENRVRLKTTYYYSATRTDEVLPSQAAWLEAAAENNCMQETEDNSLATLNVAGFKVSGDTRQLEDEGENDTVNRRIMARIRATVDEKSNVTGSDKYNQAIAMGAVVPETSGTWYVLLPEHVTVNVPSIRLRERGDRVTGVEILENYRGSSRTLVKVEAEMTPDPSYYTTGGAVDTLRLYMDLYLSWEDYSNLTEDQKRYLDYYVAFESGNPGKLGNLEPNSMYRQTTGYPDEWPPKGTSGLSTTITEAIRSLMTDLDPNTDEERFVYARSGLDLRNIDVSDHVEFRKDARSDAEGFWGRGTENETQVTVPEGGEYTYRLTVSSRHNSRTAGIFLYDAIEEHVPDDETGLAAKKNWSGVWSEKGQWKGKLTSVDLSELIARGCAPKLYYSTVTGLSLGRQGSVDPADTDVYNTDFKGWDSVYNLNNGSVWQPVSEGQIRQGVWNVPETLQVAAIAVDAQKSTHDAAYFQLLAGEKASVYLHMRAPADRGDPNSWNAKGAYAHKTDHALSTDDIDWAAAQDPANNMYAYNAATVVFVPFSAPSGSSTTGMIQNRQVLNYEYDRVGIVPETITVRKIWKDSAYLSGTGNVDNYDGLRPDSVTVRLKGVTGSSASPVIEDSLVLSADNGWEGTFLNAPETDSEGNHYSYTVTEDPVPGYTAKIARTSALNRRSYEIVNTHTKESVDITVQKLWLNPDGTPAEPPDKTITLYLSQTGKDGPTGYGYGITLNKGNNWTGTRTLDRYEVGGFEYKYAVSSESGLSSSDGWFTQNDPVPAGITVTADYDPNDVHTFRNFKKPDFGYALIYSYVNNSSRPGEGNNTELPAFTFTVELTDGNDRTVTGEYEYIVYNKIPVNNSSDVPADAEQVGRGTVSSGGTITLAQDQSAVIIGIPDGTYCSVEEHLSAGWSTSAWNNPTVMQIRTGTTRKYPFQNTYKATGPITITGTKWLRGREQKDREFSFGLTDNNRFDRWGYENEKYGEEIAVVKTGQSRGYITEGGVKTGQALFTFTPEYDYSRTYEMNEYGGTRTLKYTVKEKIPDGAQESGGAVTYNNVVYDTRTLDVTVTFTDRRDGTLDVAVTTTGGSLAFTNTYIPQETRVTLTAHKELIGRTLQPEEFSFEVRRKGAAADSAPIATGKNDVEGNITFTPAIPLSENDIPGITLLISEVQGTDPTVAYMQSPAEAEVKLAQKKDGELLTALPGQEIKYTEITCPVCGGTGKAGGLAAIRVDVLNGAPAYAGDPFILPGVLENPQVQICPICGGNGYNPDRPGQPCTRCDGMGVDLGTDPIELPDGNLLILMNEHGMATDLQKSGLPYDFIANTSAWVETVLIMPADKWTGRTDASVFSYLALVYLAQGEGSCATCGGSGKADGDPYVDGDALPVPLVNRIKTGVTFTAEKTMEGQPASVPFDFELLETDVNGKTKREVAKARNGADGKITFAEVEIDPNDTDPRYFVIREIPGTDSRIQYDTSPIMYKVSWVNSQDGGRTLDKKLLSGDGVIRNRYKDGSLAVTVTSSGYHYHHWFFKPVFPVTVTLKDSQGKPLANRTFAVGMETRSTAEHSAAAGGATLVTDDRGQGTLTIEGGKTAVVSGLPDGTSYKAEQPEGSMPEGFAQSESEGTSGTIRGGEESRASFKNAYNGNDNPPEPSPDTSSEPPPEPSPSATHKIPKTGDAAEPPLWLGMILLGLTAAAFAVILRSGKKRK